MYISFHQKSKHDFKDQRYFTLFSYPITAHILWTLIFSDGLSITIRLRLYYIISCADIVLLRSGTLTPSLPHPLPHLLILYKYRKLLIFEIKLKKKIVFNYKIFNVIFLIY